MPNWEEFDTWEPTQDYPTAPPARSSSLGKPPDRRLPAAPDSARNPEHNPEHKPADAKAASFFEEFSAAAEAAGAASASQLPQLPYGDNPGIAALLANAQNMLNADGPQHQDPPFSRSDAADTPDLPAAEIPDAMREDFDTHLAPGEPAAPTAPPARTGRKTAQRRPEPIRSEGWKSLVSGWDDLGGTGAAAATPPRADDLGTGADSLSSAPQRTSKRAAAHPDTDWEHLKAVSPRTPQRASGTSRTRADLSEPRWKSLTAQTPEGPSKLRLRRVGTGTPEPRPNEGISPLVLLAGGIILSLVSVGIGVSAGMNLAPHPTVTVTATPSDFAKPNPNNPDSIGNAGPSENPDAGAAGGLKGLKVALDPGHNGGNAAAWQQIGTNVPDGRGGQKPCNTTGTATADGYTEHEFNWKIANALKTKLEAEGATVFLTRDSDAGVGPCVDARGQFAQKVGADVMVSLHANGTTDTAQHGFFVMISEPPLNEAQKQPASDLAAKIVKALQEGGFVPQSGGSISSGVWKRSDLATLNFSEVPAAMVELGEMRNPADAALMKSDTGQERYAQSLFDGLKAWAEANRPAASPAASDAAASAATQSPAAESASPAANRGGQ